MDRTAKQTNKHYPAMPTSWYFPGDFLSVGTFRDRRKPDAHEPDRPGVHRVSIFRQPSNVPVLAILGLSCKPQKDTTAHADNGTGGNIPKTPSESAGQRTSDIPVFITQYGHCAARSGLEYRHHLPEARRWFCLSCGVYRLVQPFRSIVRSINDARSSVLYCRPEICSGIWKSRDPQYRPRVPVYLPGFCRHRTVCRNENKHGRQRKGTGQCVRGTLVAYRQIRRHLSQGVLLTQSGVSRLAGLLPVLQLPTAAPVARRKNTCCSLSTKAAYVKEQIAGGRAGGHIPPVPPLNTMYIDNNIFTKTLRNNSRLPTLGFPVSCLSFGVHLMGNLSKKLQNESTSVLTVSQFPAN